MKKFGTTFSLFRKARTTPNFVRSYNVKTDLEKQINETQSKQEKIALGNQLGHYYLRDYDFVKARDTFKEYYRMGIEIQDKVGLLNASIGLSETLFHLEDYQSALAMYDFILRATKPGNIKRFMVGSYLGIGNCYRKMANYVKSEENYMLALDCAENDDTRALIYDNLGVIHCDQKNNEKSKTYFDKALEIARKESKNQLPGILHNYGILCIQSGNNEEGRLKLEEALALAQEVGDQFIVDSTKNILQTIDESSTELKKINELFQQFEDLKKTGKFEECEAKLIEAIDIAQQFNYKEHEAYFLLTLSDWLYLLQKTDPCIKSLQRCVEVSLTLPSKEYQISNLHQCASIYNRLKMFDESKDIYQTCLNLDPNEQKRVNLMINMGGIEYIQGNFIFAKEIYSKAVKISVEEGWKDEQAMAYMGVGNSTLMLKDWSVSREFFQSGKKLNPQNVVLTQGISLANLCQKYEQDEKVIDMILDATHLLSVDFEKSNVVWKKLLEMKLEDDLLVTVLSRLAIISDSNGNQEEALDYLHRAEDIISAWKKIPTSSDVDLFKIVLHHLFRIHDASHTPSPNVVDVIQKILKYETDPSEIAKFKFELGMSNFSNGNLMEAKKWFEEVLPYYVEKEKPVECQCLTYLAEIALKEEKILESKKMFEKSLVIAREIKNKELEGLILKRIELIQNK